MVGYAKAAGIAAFVWRHRSHHRHRLDLRVPRRAPGVRQRLAAAAVHRAVVRLGPRGISASCSRRFSRGRARRRPPSSSAGCAGCSGSSSSARSTSCSSITSSMPISRSSRRSSSSCSSTAASTRCSSGAAMSVLGSLVPLVAALGSAVCEARARRYRRRAARDRSARSRGSIHSSSADRRFRWRSSPVMRQRAASATVRSSHTRRACRRSRSASADWASPS